MKTLLSSRRGKTAAGILMVLGLASAGVVTAQNAPKTASTQPTAPAGVHERQRFNAPGREREHEHEGEREHEVAVEVKGTVESYNFDGRGSYNGIVLKDGDQHTQLNFPPEMAPAISSAAAVGQTVTAKGIAVVQVGDRKIFRLASLTGADGKTLEVGRPGEPKSVHVEGTVKQLNYSPRGEVDGVVLDTGDFVHVGPHEIATLNLSVGAKVTADGDGHPIVAGHEALEADRVNGTEIDRPHPRPGEGPRGPEADGPERGGRERGESERGGRGPMGGFGRRMSGPRDGAFQHREEGQRGGHREGFQGRGEGRGGEDGPMTRGPGRDGDADGPDRQEGPGQRRGEERSEAGDRSERPHFGDRDREEGHRPQPGSEGGPDERADGLPPLPPAGE